MLSEQRGAFRVHVPVGQDEAVLRLGGRDVVVRIVNISATGFALDCPQLNVHGGDLLRLHTSAGWSEVRIVFVELNDGGCRLGVETVRDLSNESDHATTDWRYLLLLPYHQVGGAGGLLIVSGLLVALVVIGVPLLANVWPPAKNFDVSSAVNRLATQLVKDSPPKSSVSSTPVTRTVVPSPSFQPSPARVSQPATPATGITSTRFVELWRLGRVDELSARLRLSETQVQQLSDLLAPRVGASDDPTEIQQRLAEILTAEQMRAMDRQ